jgi:hypothetical protein
MGVEEGGILVQVYRGLMEEEEEATSSAGGSATTTGSCTASTGYTFTACSIPTGNAGGAGDSTGGGGGGGAGAVGGAGSGVWMEVMEEQVYRLLLL